MTRPRKQTVDYFPHYCRHGKTMHILEKKWGITGYAFWFKLLELLGSTEGHYINYNDTPTAAYLQANTRTEKNECIEILDMLAILEAIDQELWRKRIIWSQNFVDNLSDLYARRKIIKPTKESILNGENPNKEMDEIIKKQEDCRRITRQAIEKGLLIPEPCAICQSLEVESHHEDYSDPFSITWFCSSHHTGWHNYQQKSFSEGLLLTETSLTEFINARKLQSKVKDSKENKMKGKGCGENQKAPTPQKPVSVSVKKIETLLPPDFGISDQVRAWAEKNGFDRLDEHLEAFKDYAQARGRKYVDWDAAFRKAIREDWGKIRGGVPNEPRPTPKHDKSCACGGRGVVFSHNRGNEPVYRKCKGKDEPEVKPPAA